MLSLFSMYVLDDVDFDKIRKVLDANKRSLIRVASEEFSDAVLALGYIRACLERRFIPWVCVAWEG